MARKRSDNKKWMSRPSRKKLARNHNKNPCQIRKNNSKLPSNRRKKIHNKKVCSTENINLEINEPEEILNATITHDFLTERYNKIVSKTIFA